MCDGNGGFKADVGAYAGTCVESCVREHENSHLEDWRTGPYKDACKGGGRDIPARAIGSDGKPDENWIKDSECKALTDEEKCEEKINCRDAAGKEFLKKVQKDTKDREKAACDK